MNIDQQYVQIKLQLHVPSGYSKCKLYFMYVNQLNVRVPIKCHTLFTQLCYALRIIHEIIVLQMQPLFKYVESVNKVILDFKYQNKSDSKVNN